VKTIFGILAQGIAAQKVDVLLVGGYALQAYGVVRQTLDVDWLMADMDSEKMDKVLSGAGYAVAAKTDNFTRYIHDSVYLMDVDVLYIDRHTMDEMIAQSRAYRMGDTEFRVPCLMHVIALKLHAIRNNPKREARDLGDITELIRANSDSMSTDELQKACEKFGPEGIAGKVTGYLK